MKLNDAAYEAFTPAERVALVVEAMARMDVAEADRLIDTCERKRYEMPDAEYSEGFRMVHSLAMEVRVNLLQHGMSGLAAMGVIANLKNKKDRESKKRADAAVDRLLEVDAQIIGCWLAWEKFCHEIGVDPVKAMKMDGRGVPGWFQVGMVAELGTNQDHIEPDAEAYQQTADLLRYGWERVPRTRN